MLNETKPSDRDSRWSAAISLLLFFAVSPLFACGILPKTSKARSLVAGLAIVGGLALVLYGRHLAVASAEIGNATSLSDLFNAIAASFVGLIMGGLALGPSWRSSGDRAKFGMFAGIFIIQISVLPLATVLYNQAFRIGSVTATMAGYEALSNSIKVRSQLSPGYDTSEAMALEAGPYLYKELGIPTPDWMASKEGYERHRLEIMRGKFNGGDH